MRNRASPAMIVAIVALVFAATGGAIAATATKKHKDKKQDTALIKSYLANNKVPRAVHAGNATSAKNATTAAKATNATNADNAKTADKATNANAVGGNHVTPIP